MKTLDQAPNIDALTLQAILASAMAGIIMIDSRGIMKTANRAACTMFGFSESELIGRNVSILMPQREQSAHDSYISKYIETREPRIIGIGREVVGVRKDGTPFPMHLS